MFWPVQKIVVHHTETQNYDPNPAGTIRAIYHDDARLKGLGDIAYNFLIDEQGRIYEGRYSRPYRPARARPARTQLGNGVAAAHAYGYNSGTVGIALLGSFTRIGADGARPRRARAPRGLDRGASPPRSCGSGRLPQPRDGRTGRVPQRRGTRRHQRDRLSRRRMRAALPGIRPNAAALVAGRPVPAAPGTRPAPAKAPHDPWREAGGAMRSTGSGAGSRSCSRGAGGDARSRLPFTTARPLHAAGRRRAAPAARQGDLLPHRRRDHLLQRGDRGGPPARLRDRQPDRDVRIDDQALLSRAQRREIRSQAARLRSLGIP